MTIEKTFIKEARKELEVEEYLREKFERASYSHTDIQRTPLGTRIIIHVQKTGMVVGRSGRMINEVTEDIKKRFGFENPLVDVKEVENPFMDAHIVAKRIAASLERGLQYKRVASFYLQKVMESGAIGIQIRIAGKAGGSERSRSEKFKEGYIKHSGEYSNTLVDTGFARALLRPGIVGIQVKIMKKSAEEFMFKKGMEGENGGGTEG